MSPEGWHGLGRAGQGLCIVEASKYLLSLLTMHRASWLEPIQYNNDNILRRAHRGPRHEAVAIMLLQ